MQPPDLPRFYVDELTRWGRDTQLTCHLSTRDHTPEGLQALRELAKSIGAPVTAAALTHWLYPHVVLSKHLRRRAIAAGAVQLTNNELVWLCCRKEHAQLSFVGPEETP